MLWNKAFEAQVAADPAAEASDIALTRMDGTCFRWSGKVLPSSEENDALNNQYIERIRQQNVPFCL